MSIPTLCPFFSRKSKLLDFEGSAAMVFPKYVDDESVLSLWTLEGVCGKVSWTEKFDFELDYEMRYVVFCKLGVRQFVVLDNAGRYLSFDYKKKKTQN